MKIRFLGTSACWPLPRLGCHCSICSSTDLKDKRTRSSLLINDLVLVDCGPDFYHQVIKAGKLPNSIIITHAHFDHINGLYDASKIYCSTKIRLYATKPTMQVIQDQLGMNLASFEVHQIKENLSFEENNLKLTLFPVNHGLTPTFGIKIKGDRLLGYIPDFSRILPSNQKLIKDIDCLILDGSSLNNRGKSHGHISIEEGIKLAKSLKVKKVYFTHLGHKTGIHIDLDNFVKKAGGQNYNIAYDGLKIEI